MILDEFMGLQFSNTQSLCQIPIGENAAYMFLRVPVHTSPFIEINTDVPPFFLRDYLLEFSFLYKVVKSGGLRLGQEQVL